MDRSSHFKIAHVLKTHGLRGEVTIALAHDCPDLQEVKSVFIEINGQMVPHFIQTISLRGTKAFLKLDDISTPEQAASLKGCSLYLPKSARPKLARGEFHPEEVIGFEVFDEEQGVLGPVSGMMETGANRHLLIQYLGKEVMIPLNSPFIKSVNKSKKKIEVSLPEGYLDI